MKSRCEKEIVELHQFFQDWSSGALPASEESFARVAGALNEDFLIITPDGKSTERAPLLARLRAGHGTGSDTRIWVEKYSCNWEEGNIALATYEEWQEAAGRTTVRLSTALFREKTENPNGVEWLHVHETWLTP